MNTDNKKFYSEYHDEINKKRYNSPYKTRSLVHRDIYNSILENIHPGLKVLDAGCGEGTLSFMMAEKGADIVGVDLSKRNIEFANRMLNKSNNNLNIQFLESDVEKLPFESNSFDIVVSNHVLEHIPNFNIGLEEALRVSRDKIIIGIPTCLNLLSILLLGRANYWKLMPRTIISLFLGGGRVLLAYLMRKDGVDEGYAGNNTHLLRFPWVLRKQLSRRKDICLLEYYSQSSRLPILGWNLNQFKKSFILRSLGVGTIYVLTKTSKTSITSKNLEE